MMYLKIYLVLTKRHHIKTTKSHQKTGGHLQGTTAGPAKPNRKSQEDENPGKDMNNRRIVLRLGYVSWLAILA